MRNQELLDEIRAMVQPWLDELRRTLTSSMSTNERGAHRVPVPNGTVGVKISTVANELKGFSLDETTGVSTAKVILRDGTDATGEYIVGITLQPGESTTDWYGETGISVINGLFVDKVSGTVEGAVFTRSGGL